MTPRPILTAAAMRAAEAASGAAAEVLMERAGAAVADAAWRLSGGHGEVLLLCGPGNNGGDGYVAARLLRASGAMVRVAALREPRAPAAVTARAGWDGPIEALGDAQPAPVVVDALFGTGLKRRLEEEVAGSLGRLVGAGRRSIAVDLPSGVSTDDGRCFGDVPRFDLTLALGALKPAHRLLPAAERMGQIAVADIGLGEVSSDLIEIARPQLRSPGFESNKYARGKVSVVAGAMSGAALLAASAAQAAGAGYVELLGGGGGREALVRRPWQASALDDRRISAIVCGPGLGIDTAARERLDAVLEAAAPKVLDADALTLIGRGGLRRVAGEVVLTPHAGEFARLFGQSEGDALTRTRAAAAKAGAIVLLKGAMTIVAHPDGRAAIGAPAPAWLATAGTGDVLSGLIGAMLASGMAPYEAAQAGVWLHAAAARLAGPLLIADDLLAHVGAAARLCL